MTKTNCVYLQDQLQFYSSDQEQEIKSLADFENSNQAQTIVLIPSDAVSFHVLSLPKMSPHKRRLAVPYALEEELTEEIDAVYFALGPEAHGSIPVLVIAKTKMDEYLEKLQEANIEADAIIPDCLALPWKENTITVGVTKNQILIRYGQCLGLGTSHEELKTLIHLVQKKFDASVEINVINTTQESCQKYLPANIQMHEKFVSDPLWRIAQNYLRAHKVNINLLHDAKKFKKKNTLLNRYLLRVAYILGAGFLILIITDPLVSHVMLQGKFNTVQQKIALISQKYTPKHDIQIAKARMNEKIHQLHEGDVHGEFFTLLALFNKHFATNSGLSIQELTYRNGILTVMISASDEDKISKMVTALHLEGLTIKQQSAEIVNGKINTALLIRRNGV